MLTAVQMRIMLELNHPHIIKLLDFFEEKENYFMVVEKVRGDEPTDTTQGVADLT